MPLLAHSGLILPPGDTPETPSGIGLWDYTGLEHPPFRPSFLLAISTISAFPHTHQSSSLQMFGAALDRRFRPGLPFIQTCTAVTAQAFGQTTYDATYESVAAITPEDARFINLPFGAERSEAQLTQLYDTGGFQLDWRRQYSTIASHHTPYLALGGLEDMFIGGFVRAPAGPMNDQFVPVGFDNPDVVILFTSSQLPGDPNAGPYARFQIGFCCDSGSFCHAFIDASQVGTASRTASFQHPNCGLQYYNPASPTELWGRADYMGSAPGGFNLRWTDGLASPPVVQIIFMALKGLGAAVRTYSVPARPQPPGLAYQPIGGLEVACRAAIATSINQPPSAAAYDGIRTAFGFGAENAPQPSMQISTNYIGTNGGGGFLGFGYTNERLFRLLRESPISGEIPLWDVYANLTNWGQTPQLEWDFFPTALDRAAGHEYSLMLFTDKPDEGRIGGTVSGLASGGLILQLDPGAQLLQVMEDGPFLFPPGLDEGTDWTLSVRQEPVGQTAILAGATGQVGVASPTPTEVTFTPHPGPDFSGADFDAADFLVDDATQSLVSGTLSGLAAGESITLQLGGASNLILSANGPFAFAERVVGDYAVTVILAPQSQDCVITGGGNGDGTGTAVLSTDVTDIQVTCVDVSYTITGTVTGKTPRSTNLIIRNHNQVDTVISSNGQYVFVTSVLRGDTWSLAVQQSPLNPSHAVVITNGSGTATADVTDVLIELTAIITPGPTGVLAANLAPVNIRGYERIDVSPGMRRLRGVSDFELTPGTLVVQTAAGRLIPRPADSHLPMMIVDRSDIQGIGARNIYTPGVTVEVICPAKGQHVRACLAEGRVVGPGTPMACTDGGTIYDSLADVILVCEGSGQTGVGEYTLVLALVPS